MQATPSVNSEPIPGYRLIEPLGSGGFGEVWKCEAPGGLLKAVKFVHGGRDSINGDGAEAEQELRALQHVKAIRHPFLLSMERVEVVDGDLVIVMELADRSLHDLLTERRAAGHAGIDRQELLRYLEETAEVLDLMNQEYGLQHLDVKPRNLFLVRNHVKVADFGLVNSLAERHDGEGGALAPAGITPLYAAPETFLGKISLASDQYSLAVSFQELLTGTYPFAGKGARQLAVLHLTAEPHLGALPEADRSAAARALSKQPKDRFGSCTEFVRALRAAAPGGPQGPAGPGGPAGDVDQLTTHWTPADVAALSSGGAHFLAGYRFLECVGRTPAAEAWTVLDPAGRRRLLKFVLGLGPADAGHKGLARLRSLRHPALAPLHVLPAGDNRVALVTDPGELSLAARLKACQAAGQSGVARGELLGHLRAAAEALDELYAAHGLQHLALSPRHLVLADDRLRILDFALAELVWLPLGQPPGGLNPRYGAPEVSDGQVSRGADQYSLALIFAELLTGIHPFRNLNARALALPNARGKADLGLLAAPDREALLRALHPDPQRRFPTCVELVEALEGATLDAPAPGRGSGRVAVTEAGAAPEGPPPPSPGQVVGELLAQCVRGADVREFGPLRYRLRDGRRIEHQCWARIVPGTAKLKMEGFREHWGAEGKDQEGPAFAYKIRAPATLWQRWVGNSPHLDVRVRLLPPCGLSPLTPITITIEPVGCSAVQGAHYLQKAGPHILQSARIFLQAEAAGGPERHPFEAAVHFHPANEDGLPGGPLPGHARELSRVGMSLVLPTRPPSPEGYVQLRPGAPPVPAEVLRAEACPGGFEVELAFVGEEFGAIQ